MDAVGVNRRGTFPKKVLQRSKPHVHVGQHLRAAMKVRAFRPTTSWHTYRTFGYLVGMMLVRAIERSERILAAMKCRGFSGRLVLLQDFVYTRRDAMFGLLLVVICATLLRLDVTWP